MLAQITKLFMPSKQEDQRKSMVIEKDIKINALEKTNQCPNGGIEIQTPSEKISICVNNNDDIAGQARGARSVHGGISRPISPGGFSRSVSPVNRQPFFHSDRLSPTYRQPFFHRPLSPIRRPIYYPQPYPAYNYPAYNYPAYNYPSYTYPNISSCASSSDCVTCVATNNNLLGYNPGKTCVDTANVCGVRIC